MLTDIRPGGTDRVARVLQTLNFVFGRVDKTTVNLNAHRAASAQVQNLVVRRGAPAKGLTRAAMDKRLQFACACTSRSWNPGMFMNRHKSYFRYPGSSVSMARWEVEGPVTHVDPGVYQPDTPQAVHVYAGITPFGVSSAHILAETSCRKSFVVNEHGNQGRYIAQDECQAVLAGTMLPEGHRTFSAHSISSWVLHHDNDLAHKVTGCIVVE